MSPEERKVQRILRGFREVPEERLEYLEKAIRWSVYLVWCEERYGGYFDVEVEH